MSEHDTIEEGRAPQKRNLLPLGLAGLALLVGLAVLAFFQGKLPTSNPLSPSAIKQVACIDQDAIYQLPEFKTASDEMEKYAKTKTDEFEKKVKEVRNPTKDQQLKFQAMYNDLKMDLNKKQHELQDPLKHRAEAAVLQVARTKGATVVLDKRIIVYGVPDITEEVKNAFKTASADVKLPDQPDTSSAPIGYFDQEVVRNLKVFQQADLHITQMKLKLMNEYQEKTRGRTTMSPADRELMEREFKLRLEAFQEQTMQPLLQKVNEAVKEVATSQGLSLVLDKQHVMQGGRNMTNEVVDAFLKKVGEPAAATPAAPGTPTPAATTTPGGH